MGDNQLGVEAATRKKEIFLLNKIYIYII